MGESVDKLTLIDALRAHLVKRPIAAIFEKSNEKNDGTALKFMCLVDYYVSEHKLYEKFVKYPKLLSQLLHFHSYRSFVFYSYPAIRTISGLLLQCKFCELTGPYSHILTHMAINHNAHIGLKQCAYCNRCQLIEHIQNGTLNTCYQHYITTHGIDPNAVDVDILNGFYKLLKNISSALDVVIPRSEAFAGIGYRKTVDIERLYGPDFPSTCTIYSPRNTGKRINVDKLNHMFGTVISFMYGGNGLSRFDQRQEQTTEDSIIISDDEEDDGAQASTSNRTADKNTNGPIEYCNGTSNVTMIKTEKEQPEEPRQNPIEANLSNQSHEDNENVQMNLRSSRNLRVQSDNMRPSLQNPLNDTPIANDSKYAQEESPPPAVIVTDPQVFGQFVADRLKSVRDMRKRRKLELFIQEAIINVQKEEIE